MTSLNQARVSVEQNGQVAVVRFFPLPDGTINSAGAALLSDRLEELMGKPAVVAIVLTGGADNVFIRHANLTEIAKAAEALEKSVTREADFLASPFQRLCRLLDHANKPVIAAINGICMGGGFEIALACTLRIAARNVGLIGLPEVRLGIPPGAGGPQRLARLIGSNRARIFVLDGTIVKADEALKLGLIDEVATDALSRAIERAAGFASRDPAVIAELLKQMRFEDDPQVGDNAIGFARCLQVPGKAEMLQNLANSDLGIETLP